MRHHLYLAKNMLLHIEYDVLLIGQICLSNYVLPRCINTYVNQLVN